MLQPLLVLLYGLMCSGAASEPPGAEIAGECTGCILSENSTANGIGALIVSGGSNGQCSGQPPECNASPCSPGGTTVAYNNHSGSTVYLGFPPSQNRITFNDGDSDTITVDDDEPQLSCDEAGSSTRLIRVWDSSEGGNLLGVIQLNCSECL